MFDNIQVKDMREGTSKGEIFDVLIIYYRDRTVMIGFLNNSHWGGRTRGFDEVELLKGK